MNREERRKYNEDIIEVVKRTAVVIIPIEILRNNIKKFYLEVLWKYHN